jgi:hypothetical protein
VYDMTTSELIEYLRTLPTDQSHVSIPVELIDDIVTGLSDDINIVTESGEELAQITGETATQMYHYAIEQYVLDAVVHGLYDGPVGRLRGIAELGWGRLSKFEALHVLALIEGTRHSIGTITMGGEAHDIVKRGTDEP